MGITINTNIQSVFAQRALRSSTKMVGSSIEKLSTGSRINRAGDDAAGLSIAQKATTLVKGMDQAQRNIGDGIAMISTIDGALGVVQDNLQRIRELTVQALNGTNGTDEKDAIQREINERVTAINEMGANATFNGVSLLRSTTDITLQSGANDSNTLILKTAAGGTAANTGFFVDFTSTGSGSLGEGAIALSTFTIGSANVKTLSGSTSATATSTALAKLDTMIKNVSRMRSQGGAYENSLASNIEYLDRYSESLQSARSRVQDVDVAAESAQTSRAQILQQSAATMLTQANATPQIALNLLP
ncbi:MAG: flagellin FliC [Cyanobacteria bacterium REEB446]|nr:flagellin FliC [Cyanobacteria bacterium REEB446]